MKTDEETPSTTPVNPTKTLETLEILQGDILSKVCATLKRAFEGTGSLLGQKMAELKEKTYATSYELTEVRVLKGSPFGQDAFSFKLEGQTAPESPLKKYNLLGVVVWRDNAPVIVEANVIEAQEIPEIPEIEELRDCPDCGVKPGQPHKGHGRYCDVERCSNCGAQRVSCGCPPKSHDEAFARWTGLWPGTAESKALGVDLNEFYRQGHYEFFLKKPKAAKISKRPRALGTRRK
jgi:hypothetical protein